jgi:protein-tyrosine-phosphatase
MERGHKDALQDEFPGRSGRIYMLSEMVGQEEDIADPIGGSLEEYEAAARQLELILNEGFLKISRLAR